jgi:hypothetical protein
MSRVNLFGVVMILLVINIFLYAGGVKVVESEGFLARFVDVPDQENLLYSDQTLTVSSGCENNECLKDAVPTTLQDTGGSGVLTFIDAIKTIFDFVLFLVNIVFTPIGLFMNMPSIIGLMLGVPLLFAGVFGIVSLVRSGA